MTGHTHDSVRYRRDCQQQFLYHVTVTLDTESDKKFYYLLPEYSGVYFIDRLFLISFITSFLQTSISVTTTL